MLTLLSFLSPAFAAPATGPNSSWTYVEKTLKGAHLRADFIAALKATYEPRYLARVSELNVLLYLRRHDDHAPQANDDGRDRVRGFLKDQAPAFARARARYGVDPAVIASLLYIESRFGKNVGHFHVASVFLDLLQVDRPARITHLLEAAPTFRSPITRAIHRDIARRAKIKARWALGELRAIARLFARDPGVLGWRGSFAGAVGWPQFLPSSYLTFARAARAGRTPDLGRADDAIFSVAHYLHRGGFRLDQPRTHEPALLKYNQSHDYARAILKLARASAPTVRRRLSGVAENRER